MSTDRTWVDGLSAVPTEDLSEPPDPAQSGPQPFHIDGERYQRGRELGQGGMGRVTLATDAVLCRQVAVKELLVQHPATQRRFLREARLTAQLEHPGIVPVYELGHHADGTLFYTMKEVRGHTLRDAIDAAEGLPERLALLGVLVDVCQALGYAHSKGVVHRDLKPENVMIGAFGETTVLDWGLAKVAGEPDPDLPETVGSGTSNLTRAGAVMGTPKYMSPEQASGTGQVDARSDVWAIGVILYELLAGDVPFEGTSASVLEQVQVGVWMAPDQLQRGLPPALVTSCMKMLEKRPEDRYAHAGQVAQELDAWRNGASVGAHSYGAIERLQQHAGRVRLAGIVLGTFALGAAVAWPLARSTLRDVERSAQATSAQQVQLQRLADAVVAAETDPGRALALLRSIPSSPHPAVDHLARTLHDGDVRILSTVPAEHVTFSPSGTRVVWAEENHVRLVDPDSGSDLGRVTLAGPVSAFALSLDEGTIWAATGSTVVAIDPVDLTERLRVKLPSPIGRLVPTKGGVFTVGTTAHHLTRDGQSTPAAVPPLDPAPVSLSPQAQVDGRRFRVPWTPSSADLRHDGGALVVAGPGGVALWSLQPSTSPLSNLRLCPDGSVVPVLPFPSADQLTPPTRACPPESR